MNGLIDVTSLELCQVEGGSGQRLCGVYPVRYCFRFLFGRWCWTQQEVRCWYV